MPQEKGNLAQKKENNKNVSLPYDLDYIPVELKKRAKSELFEDEDTRVNSLRLLRSMLKDETNLKFQDEDLFLLSFLRARKFEVKRAFNLMKTFYNVKDKHKELYENFDFSDVRKTLAENHIGFLPYRDTDGCVILVISIARWNPQENSLGDIMRALTSTLIVAVKNPATQIAGLKVIFDFTGFSLSHLPHVTPSYLWLFAEALQNCFPCRFRAVHIVNEGYIFSSIWSILKKLLSQKLRDRFHFHGKNIKKLHKYFSPSILPAEYEGELPSFDSSSWLQEVEKNSEYIVHAHSFGYKKSRRGSQDRKSTNN